MIRGSAPIDDTDRCNDGCRPDRPYDNGHGGPSEAPGIKRRGCKKYQQQDPIASRDSSVPMWNIRRGCQPFSEQLGIANSTTPLVTRLFANNVRARVSAFIVRESW
jgi:hypothetical protein